MSNIIGRILLETAQAEGKYKESILLWQKQGLSYTASGYGRKIPTSHMIRHNGRWKRVYCCVCSNIGTCYILSGNDWIVID